MKHVIICIIRDYNAYYLSNIILTMIKIYTIPLSYHNMIKIYKDDSDDLVEISVHEIKKIFTKNKLQIKDSVEKSYFNQGIYTEHILGDTSQAVHYYTCAAQLGNIHAMKELGGYYYYVEKDFEMAKEYFLMGCKLGDAQSINNIGAYYCEIEKDFEKAKEYYLQAIELNYPMAMYNLGNYYYEIENDYEKAVEYYLMAIKLDFPFAMCRLAKYYHNIEGNNEKAVEYYVMAIKLNIIDAKEEIKTVTNELERYVIYKNNDIKYDEEITRDIHIYNNKLKLHKKIHDCPVCLVDNIECIPINCFGHYICIHCYPKLYNESCVICRL